MVTRVAVQIENAARLRLIFMNQQTGLRKFRSRSRGLCVLSILGRAQGVGRPRSTLTQFMGLCTHCCFQLYIWESGVNCKNYYIPTMARAQIEMSAIVYFSCLKIPSLWQVSQGADNFFFTIISFFCVFFRTQKTGTYSQTKSAGLESVF